MSEPYIKHGTRTGYQRGCRLECCRKAQREYSAEWWSKNRGKRKRVTRTRSTAGVMHEFDALPSKYIPSNSRGQHQFRDPRPELEAAPDISFECWSKRRLEEVRRRA
jgi:hypothetical protein